MATYTFALTDFPNGEVNISNLQEEIRQSAIITAIDYINSDDTSVYIIFKAALSSGDQTILDGDTSNPAGGLIAAHAATDKSPLPTIVEVKEEYGVTNGKYLGQAIWVEAPTGISNTDMTFDIPCSIMELQFTTTDENVGDSVTVYTFKSDTGYGEGVIGSITSSISSGETGIPVAKIISDNVYTGDYISLKEGGKEEELGLIKSIDKTNNILYVKVPTATSFSHTSPTFIKLKRYVLNPFPLGPPQKYILGECKIGGSYLTPDKTVRVSYTNNGNSAKRLYTIVERLE